MTPGPPPRSRWRASLPERETALHVDDPSLLLLNEDIGACYEAVARTVAAALGAESCSLALYDAHTDELIARRPRYAATGQAVPQFRFPLDVAPASARVVRTGEPYLSNTPATDPLYQVSIGENGVRAILTTPVRCEGRLLGLLYVLNKPGGFTAEDVATAQDLADAVGVTLENIHLYAEEKNRRLLNESLREVSRALVGLQSEETALGVVLDQMWRVLRYDAAGAFATRGDHLLTAARGMAPQHLEALPAELEHLRESRRAGIVTDAARRFPELGLPARSGPLLVSPLVAREHALGLLVVAFPAEYEPTVRDRELLGLFADHAALFLQAGAVLARERQARSRTATLARVSSLAVRRQDAASLLRDACPELLSVAGADRVVAYVRHRHNRVLIPTGDAGLALAEAADVREMRLDFSSGPLAALLDGRPLMFDADTPLPASRVIPIQGVVSLVALPLWSQAETIGAIFLAWVQRPHRLDAAALDFLNDVAQQLALGVENATLVSRLAEMATTDELTQLANRRRFSEFLRAELSRCRRTSTGLALVLADLDFLKKVNDSLGHPAGDRAIRHVADVFRRGARITDCAARLGGEEFALVLCGSDMSGGLLKAERMREEIAGHPVDGVGQVTVSMGLAVYPTDGTTEDELVAAADRRLYAAKGGGRNRVCWKDGER